MVKDRWKKRERRSFMRNGCGGKVQREHLSVNSSDRRQKVYIIAVGSVSVSRMQCLQRHILSVIAVHLLDEGLHGHVFCQDFSRLLA